MGGSLDLSVTLAGVRLRNPLILASGILGTTAGLMLRVWRAGAGAVVTKSITAEPREGNPNPVVVDLGYALINSMGLPNPGVEGIVGELERLRAEGVVVVVSVAASSPEEAELVASRVSGLCDAVEVNLSCPHVGGYGLEVAWDPDLAREVVGRVRRASGRPVLVKLSPHLPDPAGYAEMMVRAGADAVVVSNTLRAMAIDVWSRRPVLGGVYGGLSGPPLKYVTLRMVYEIYERLPGIPIVGVGGVETWADAVEYLLAGARAVGVGTAVARRGIGVFGEILRGMKEYMESEGFGSVEEMVGLAHEA